jgi:hypothetical protein
MPGRTDFEAWAAATGKCQKRMKAEVAKSDELLTCVWRGLAKRKRGQNVVLSPDACIYSGQRRLTKLRPSTGAAGNIPGKIPDAPVSAGKAQWFLSRIANNWFLFPSAFATRPQRLVRHLRRVLLCTLYIASVRS